MKSGEHAFIFSLPHRNVSFTFTVNPEQIAKMGPKKRARQLNEMSYSMLCTVQGHLTAHEWCPRVSQEFRNFRHEVLDFAASGIGEVK